MTSDQDKSSVTARGSSAPVHTELDAFLAEIKGRATAPTGTRGRLIFGLDATASRQPTWDIACQLQAEMFREVATIGSLDMQLVYYRGLGECRASRWISHPDQLAKTPKIVFGEYFLDARLCGYGGMNDGTAYDLPFDHVRSARRAWD